MTDVHDPYGDCELECHHDLARGVLTSELQSEDGPEGSHANAFYPYWSQERGLLINTAAQDGSWQNWLSTAQQAAQDRAEI